jgi:hypothetical protein
VAYVVLCNPSLRETQPDRAALGNLKEKEEQMTHKEYNGWTNYETWLVKLWMDNEEGSSSFWNDVAQTAYNNEEADATFTREENAALALADSLKEQHEEVIEEAGVPQNGFIADLLNAAMSEVNWHEIATSLLDDVEKEEAE